MWRELPDSNKDVCYTRLLQWFEVDGWNTMRVKKLVNQALQSSYRTWRNVLLHTHYKKILKSNGYPMDGSPREEFNMTQWKGFCNYVETPDFKDKSVANSASRRLLVYNHISGKYRYLTHYGKMVKPDKIENWKNVHTNKIGQFANDIAAITWGVMQRLRAESLEEGAIPISEDEILVKSLGCRSGSQKGLGGGAEVYNETGIHSSPQHDPMLTQQLSETQNELNAAKDQTQALTQDLDARKEINKTNKTKLEDLQRQMQQMQMFQLMQENTLPRSDVYFVGKPEDSCISFEVWAIMDCSYAFESI